MSTIMSSCPPTKPAPADLHQDVAGVEPVGDGGPLGMTEKARVDTGVPQGQRLAVDLHGAILERPDQIVGGVLQGEQVAAVLPAEQVPATSGSIGSCRRRRPSRPARRRPG